MKKTDRALLITATILLAGFLVPIQGAVVIKDDFGSSHVLKEDERLLASDIDAGWHAERSAPSAWTISGSLQNSRDISDGAGESAVAQVVTLDSSHQENRYLTISFSYSTTDARESLYVHLWGYNGDLTGGLSVGQVANFQAAGGFYFDCTSDAGEEFVTAYNLLDGSPSGAGGIPFVALSGSGLYRATIDMESLGISGVNRVGDLEYIGLAFARKVGGTGSAVTIDNLLLESTTTRPAGLGMPLQGTVIMRDDFKSSHVSKDSERVNTSDINAGWQADRGAPSAWTIRGSLQNAGDVADTASEGAVVQMAAVDNRHDGNRYLELSFDYRTAGAGETLCVHLWGYDGELTGGLSVGHVANFQPASGLYFDCTAGAGEEFVTAYNLLDGSEPNIGGTPLAALSGSGVYRTSIELASLGIPGVSHVGDLECIGLAFTRKVGGAGSAVTIHNLLLASAAEASTIGNQSQGSDRQEDLRNAVTARGEYPQRGQTCDKAFDGEIQSTWLDFEPQGSWIQYGYDAPTVITRYAITSADVFFARDPKDWMLLASNDETTWMALDFRSGELWANRNEQRRFSFKNKTPYRFYRLNIASVREPEHAGCVQIAEIELLE